MNFHGENVLLFADCCFSGTLSNVAKELDQHGFHAASLTSAGVLNQSTSSWTFTLSLVEALSGHPLADAETDGVITLDEAAAEIR